MLAPCLNRFYLCYSLLEVPLLIVVRVFLCCCERVVLMRYMCFEYAGLQLYLFFGSFVHGLVRTKWGICVVVECFFHGLCYLFYFITLIIVIIICAIAVGGSFIVLHGYLFHECREFYGSYSYGRLWI